MRQLGQALVLVGISFSLFFGSLFLAGVYNAFFSVDAAAADDLLIAILIPLLFIAGIIVWQFGTYLVRKKTDTKNDSRIWAGLSTVFMGIFVFIFSLANHYQWGKSHTLYTTASSVDYLLLIGLALLVTGIKIMRGDSARLSDVFPFTSLTIASADERSDRLHMFVWALLLSVPLVLLLIYFFLWR